MLSGIKCMKERMIEHRGVVEQIVSHTIKVAIVQESACAACAAAQFCHSSEKEKKVIDIPVQDASHYQVGQPVTIVGELGLGLRAALWAYVAPLVLLMAVLLTASSLGCGAGMSALLALGSLLPYYIILYALRDKLQKRFTFRIKNQ